MYTGSVPLFFEVFYRGLNLLIAGDWFSIDLIKKAAFYDDNTERRWHAFTGGSNIPALNELLDTFGFAFGETS